MIQISLGKLMFLQCQIVKHIECSVVYQSKYLQYYEDARIGFFKKLGALQMMHNEKKLCMVSKAAVKFKVPLAPDDSFAIKLALKVDGGM